MINGNELISEKYDELSEYLLENIRNNSDFEQLAIVWNAVDRLGK